MSDRCYIVAEIGSNHDGEIEQAYRLIDEAARAGANAVKVQCLSTFPREWMPDLMAYAERIHRIDCFATVFDISAVRVLAALDVPFIKIASVEMADRELFRAAAKTGIPLIVSTGMATWDEIDWVASSGVTLLQCTTLYPTPPAQVNLRAMVNMREHYGLPTGLSDHTAGIAVPIAAAALGASMIEKHITLEPERCKNPHGPDHAFALWPSALRAMVDGIREVEQAMGDGEKNGPVDGEPFELRGRRLQWQT